MSILPQENLPTFNKINNKQLKQFNAISHHPFKLTPINQQPQSKPKQKISICAESINLEDIIKQSEQISRNSLLKMQLMPSVIISKHSAKQNNDKSSVNRIQEDNFGEGNQNFCRTKVNFQMGEMPSNLSNQPLNQDVSEQLKDKNSKNQQKKQKPFVARSKILIKSILQNIYFQIFITFLTVCSLFIQDFRSIFIPKQNDIIIDYIDLTLLSCFFTQILLSLTLDNYPFTFFFYLDLISTLSIVMDVNFITNLIYQGQGNSQQLSLLISQSKASRAAARAVRIMKIFRLARVVKLYKSAIKARELNQNKQKELLKRMIREKKNRRHQGSQFMNSNFEGDTSDYKMSFNQNNPSTKQKNSKSSPSQSFLKPLRVQQKRASQIPIDNIMQQKNQQSTQNLKIQYDLSQYQKQSTLDDKRKIPKPLQFNKKQSNISRILTDSTIKKVIIVILIIMFSITALDINNYYPESSGWDFTVQYAANLLSRPKIPVSFINNVISKQVDNFNNIGVEGEIAIIQTPFNELYRMEAIHYSDLRFSEIEISQYAINVSQIMQIRPQLTLYSNSNSTTGQQAVNSLTVILTFKRFNTIDAWFSMATIIFICCIIIYLLQSFNENITDLVVTPIEKMLDIIVNPSKTLNKDANQEEEQANQNSDFKQAQYQTLIVQKAILKIRGLMSTIFGKIGMDLLYKQLFKPGNANANNYLATKSKSYCIYGIIRLQNFIQISQTLQADTFTFINEIAHIVHSAAYRYGGYGVKNLNDGFLVVFKLPEGRQQQILDQSMKAKVSKQKKNSYLNLFSDYSIFSLVKIIVRLFKEPKLLKYKKDQRILHKFGNNFQIEMNFAIGIGQSIQGIVGSEFKIDPVYLGGKLDQVNVISSISQKYPNMIIMEKQIYDNLTIGLKRHCRIMDMVKLNDYEQSQTSIYAVDLDLQYISPSRSKSQKYKKPQDQPDIHFKREMNLQTLKTKTQIYNYNAQSFISQKKQLRQVLKKKFSQEVKRKYQIAFQAYCSGEWNQAKIMLEEIIKVCRDDVLTIRIYQYMADRLFKCPETESKYKSVKEF